MIIRQDLKSVSEQSMKYVLDAHEDLRGPLPLAYHIKDISGHWYH